MAVGLGLVAAAFGALWRAEIIDRRHERSDRLRWRARRPGGVVAGEAGRAGCARCGAFP